MLNIWVEKTLIFNLLLFLSSFNILNLHRLDPIQWNSLKLVVEWMDRCIYLYICLTFYLVKYNLQLFSTYRLRFVFVSEVKHWKFFLVVSDEFINIYNYFSGKSSKPTLILKLSMLTHLAVDPDVNYQKRKSKYLSWISFKFRIINADGMFFIKIISFLLILRAVWSKNTRDPTKVRVLIAV